MENKKIHCEMRFLESPGLSIKNTRLTSSLNRFSLNSGTWKDELFVNLVQGTRSDSWMGSGPFADDLTCLGVSKTTMSQFLSQSQHADQR